ncbi:hypothetical protein [Marinibactrum halimedae]|uniref:Uncharacterized protein n=1 Tax=Marinibactrum halimedae TaxID=1444977 RepID=A0AA37WN55_9GAMM|nr:hypothetical protein [Marinibactrum halimedae]MCD9459066.1 hypothetical protein [Marinibactrum halimedae]GLS24667.1 hypothetical protein GCM10007877_03810 [Marinibactrum halimedae]
MPEWIIQEMIRYFDHRGIPINQHSLPEGYLQIDLAYDGVLEVDYLPAEESLLFSLRLVQDAHQAIVRQMLAMNHYLKKLPFSPTCHLYDSSIVLRTCLVNEAVSLVNIESVFTNLLQRKQILIDNG